MEKKSIFITAFITIFLFSFVFFLIYVVYCFAFFDKNQENEYLKNFNSGSYEFVYDNLVGQENITKEEYDYSVSLMFKRTKLNDIHHKYYSDMDINDFMDTYYYGGYVNMDDLVLTFNGKTDLFNRRSLRYQKIKVNTISGNNSVFGVMKDIYLLVDSNTKLYVDDIECEMANRGCYYKYLLGGLHTIMYEKEDAKYFGIINIIKDNQEISINNLENLVVVKEDQDNE